jgi:hypothetical protein
MQANRIGLDGTLGNANAIGALNPHNGTGFLMGLAVNLNGMQPAKGRTMDEALDTAAFVPAEVYPLDNPQTDLPRIAKDKKLVALIEEAVSRVPTRHSINLGDARRVAHPFKCNSKSHIKWGCPTLPRSLRKGGRRERTRRVAHPFQVKL